MALYRISGIWINADKIITHYAFHLVNENSVDRVVKKTKEQAIALLNIQGNSATTWVWNYTKAFWEVGEKVEIVNGSSGKYLRSNPDNKLTDNLKHLIDFDWIAP